MNIKKITYILIFIFVFSLGFYTTVSAASYIKLTGLFSAKNLRLKEGESIGPHGCPIRLGDSLETCDIEPGDYMTTDGTVEWGAGFLSGLPAMGMGGVGIIPLGYIPASYNGIYCAAGSSYPGSGPGNSTLDGKICEITFNTPIAGTGNAWYNVYAEPSAIRGSKYKMGLASNGGSNTLQVDFYVRVKPLACIIESFSCSGGVLTWNTSPICTTREISNVGNVGVSGSTNVQTGTYILTVSNGETGDFSLKYCEPSPALTARWTENSATTITKEVVPGTIQNVNLNFSNTGDAGSTVNVTGCSPIVVSGTVGTIVPDCPPTSLTK